LRQQKQTAVFVFRGVEKGVVLANASVNVPVGGGGAQTQRLRG